MGRRVPARARRRERRLAALPVDHRARRDLDCGRATARSLAVVDRSSGGRGGARGSAVLGAVRARPCHLQIQLVDRAPCGPRPSLQARRQPSRRPARPVSCADRRSASDDRGRAARRPAHRPGDLPRRADDYWGARCPITGITDPELLRASHIVPWSECDDAQRLDVHNGLLLSALWDAAFDARLASFPDDGTVLASPGLSAAAHTALGIGSAPRLPNLRDAHRANLTAHRARHGFR